MTFAWPARGFASTRLVVAPGLVIAPRLEVHLPPPPAPVGRPSGERGTSTPNRAVAGGVTRTNGAISARHVGSGARARARARPGGTSETRATPNASAGASGTAGDGPSDPSETTEETGETGETGEIGEIGIGEGPSETSGAGGRAGRVPVGGAPSRCLYAYLCLRYE